MHVPCPTEISDTPALTAKHTKFTWQFNALIAYLHLSTNFEFFSRQTKYTRTRYISMVLASPVALNDHRFVGETRSARPYALTIHDPLATEGTKTVSKHRRSNIEIRLRDERFYYRFRSHVTSLFSFFFSRHDNVPQQKRKCNELERKGEKTVAIGKGEV